VTARRPSKPWRVIVTGPDVTAESSHISEDGAYTFVRGALGAEGSAEQARVECWEDGRWRWFETIRKEDMA
jgi:hypothetical protein